MTGSCVLMRRPAKSPAPSVYPGTPDDHIQTINPFSLNSADFQPRRAYAHDTINVVREHEFALSCFEEQIVRVEPSPAKSASRGRLRCAQILHHQQILPSVTPPRRAAADRHLLEDRVWVRRPAPQPIATVFASQCALIMAGIRYLELRMDCMSDVEIPLDAWPRYHDGRPKIMKQRIVEGMIDGSQCVKNLSPQLLSEVQASLCHLNLRQLVVIRTHMAENCTAMRGVQPGLAAFGLKVEAIISERVITVMLSRDPTRKTHQRLIGASPHDLFKTPVNVDGPTSEPAPSWGSEFSVADRRQLGLSVLQTLGVTQLSVHDFDVDEWLFVSGNRPQHHSKELGPWGVYFQLSSLAAVRNVLQETSIVTVHPAEMNQGFVRPDAANKWVVLRLPPLGELSALEPPSMMSVVTQLNAAVKAREKRMQEVEAAGATVAVAPATQAAPEATAKCETRPRPKPRLWMLKSIASSTFEAFESALPPLTRFQSGDLDPVHERDSESTHKHPSIIGGPRRYSAGIVMRKGPTLAMTARTRHSSVPSASGMSTSRRAERVLSGMSTGRPDGLISATENLAEDDSPPSKEVPASHSPHSCSTQNRSNGAPKGVRRFFMRLRRPRTHF